MSSKVIQCAVGIICAGLLSVSVGCAGKKLSTSASDQTMIPGEKPQTEAQSASPPSAEASAPTITPQTEAATARAEAVPEASAPQPEPSQAEAPAEGPKMEEAKTESIPPSAAPSGPPPVEQTPSAPLPPSVTESAPPIAESAPPIAESAPPAAPPSSAPTSPEAVMTLADVFFDFDRFAIRQDAQATLEANARWLKTVNGRKVLVEGHCDERGTVEYNLVLGEKRAQSVKQYLQELGVPASQIQITSFGKERPFCTEHSDACWQQNRRAHFVLQ
jgi:peptidoglycan-associated lipoprotein